jgi:hypothetical protein
MKSRSSPLGLAPGGVFTALKLLLAYQWAQYPRVCVPGKPFKPGVM